MGYSWELLLDPSLALLLVVVIFTLFLGAMRSLSFLSFQAQQLSSEDREASEVKLYFAIVMPVLGSAMLLILFYFLDWLSVALVILFSISCFFAVVFFLDPVFTYAARKFQLQPEFRVSLLSTTFPTSYLMGSVPALALVVAWLLFRFWLFTDLLALCLGVMAMALLRLPNLMVASAVLWVFFFYDIFWVFLSSYIFGDNVMVHVATSLPSLPIILIIPRIIYKGYSLLGLGDIILPGIYLAFLYRFDYAKSPWESWRFTGYFRVGLIAYVVGLIWTFVMLIVLQTAQPALLYLVPSLMVSTIPAALIQKEFLLLWRGKPNGGGSITDDALQDIEQGEDHLDSPAYSPVDTKDKSQDYGEKLYVKIPPSSS